jgi:hypothetical protein
MEKILIGLVALLIANMLVGAIRKLYGGSFIPPPSPSDDQTRQDRHGRWWRITPDGMLEEIFPRRH